MKNPTKGRFILDGINGYPWTVHVVATSFEKLEKSPSTGKIATVEDVDGTVETRTANARLIAEAFNVYAETGLTPRQLADRIEKLVAVMGSAVGGVGYLARSHGGINPELVQMWEEWESKARSALSAAIAPQTP